MPSTKERIATYVDAETLRKFKVVAAIHNQSMSSYLNELIQKAIKDDYNIEFKENDKKE